MNEKSNELHKLQQLMDNLHPNESFDIKNSKIDGNNMRKSNLKRRHQRCISYVQEVLQEQLASLSGMLENPSTDYYEEDRLRSNGGQQVSKEDELKRSFYKIIYSHIKTINWRFDISNAFGNGEGTKNSISQTA